MRHTDAETQRNRRILRVSVSPHVVMVAIVLSIGIQANGQITNQSISATYRFTVAGGPVRSGTLWLFYYGWGYLGSHRLGEVRDGLVNIALSPAVVRDEIQPPPNMDAFLIALHVPGVGWFRSEDRRDFLSETLTGIDELGRLQLAGNTRAVDLPPPVKQTLRIQKRDGSPRSGLKIQVETLVSTANHCGFHQSLDKTDAVHHLVTDANGIASFVAPLAPLYLRPGFYEVHYDGLGQRLTFQQGQRLPARRDHTIRQVWDPAPDRVFSLLAQHADGSPAKAFMFGNHAANVCGATWGRLGQSDAEGKIVVSFAPEHMDRLWISQDSKDYDDDRLVLTEQQMAQLYKTGSLIVKVLAPK